jgi:N-acetylmuramoyl-L-alanine amidase
MSLFPRRFVPAARVSLFICVISTLEAQATGSSHIDAVRFWSFGDVTRIAIQTIGDYQLHSEQIANPERVYFDLNGLRPPSASHRGMQTITVGDSRVRQIRLAEVAPGKTRIVLDLERPVEVISSQLVNPDRLMIEVRPRGTSLPALSNSRTVTGSLRVSLSAPPTEEDSDITGPVVAERQPSVTQKPTSQKDLQSFEDRQAEPSKQQLAIAGAPVKAASRPPSMAQPTSSTTVVVPAVSQPLTTSVPPPAPPPAITASAPNAPVDVASREPLPGPLPKPGLASIPAQSGSGGDRSLVRVFGLKLGRVVIDAGHGGKDTGTIGPNGLLEKELVLDVALRLGRLITQQLGADVVYTRSNDVFIPLEERTRIANQQKADLFISVHANASAEPTATGVETYYFNLTSDRTGLDLAMRENASAGSAISDLSDLLHRAVLQTKLAESREFAQRVQESLLANSTKMNVHAHDRGVRQAPFVVLIGATMPSILAEIGFVSNPHDERLMKRTDQRDKIAEALLKGVTQYANSLSHSQIARAGSD